MPTMVKGIQYSLLVLMLLSVLLVLWNIEYVTVRTSDYNRFIYQRTTTRDKISSNNKKSSPAGLDILYIPKIRIHFTSKNMNGSATADNVRLVKGNTKTSFNIIKRPQQPLSHVNNPLVKVNDSHYPANDSENSKTGNQQTSVHDLSVTADSLQTHVDDLLVTTDNPSTSVSDIPVTTDYQPTPINDFQVTLDNQSTRVNDFQVTRDNQSTPIIDLLVTTEIPQTNVTDFPVATDNPTTDINNILTTTVNVKDSTNDKWTKYRYPLDVDMVELVRKVKLKIPVHHKPLFPYRYTFTHHRIEKCASGSPFFIFLIKSAVSNVKSRAAIRDTWAHSKLQKKYNFIRIFLVGSSDNSSVISKVKSESSKYSDIVRMSFRDNYYNNTLKTIGAIHWTVKNCNRAKFVIFVDDDMLVSVKSLYSFLHTTKIGPTFFGGHIDEQHPQRHKGDKWYVSEQDYPYDIYPPMPSGGFLIMTMNFVIDLHIAAHYTRKFIYDDVYLAILAYKLRVTPVNIPNVYVFPNIDTKLIENSLAVHGFDPSSLKLTWKLFKRSYVDRNNMS